MTIALPRPAGTRQHGRPARNTGIDLVRAWCVVGVVTLHALMVGVTVTDAGPLFANASDGSWWITTLSWVLQVMPLFFVIGGFAGFTAYRRARQRGGSAAGFVASRIHRLLLPAVCTIGVVAIVLLALLASGVAGELVGIAGYRFGQPLWFLGVFLLCQVLLPIMVAAHERAPWAALALLVLGAVVVDAVRIATGADAVGILNLAVIWLALQQVGFFLADGRIAALTRRTRAVVGLVAAGALVLSFVLGIHSPDLIANINPPTTALLLVGVAHTMLVSLMSRRLTSWSENRFGAALRAFITPRAMTIYLWHMPVLLAMAGACAVFAIASGFALPAPSSPEWWITRPLWLATAFGLTALVAAALAGVEARTAPPATTSIRRLVSASALGVVAVALLLVVGASPATAALAVAMMLLALRLAGETPDHPRSAPWPMRSAGIDANRIRAIENANTTGNV
ncbi:acyltransferase [Microbacterium sp. NPDC077644]|uniref:acyltransferase family protein n=1 Tax=Microbacterium sp. NPDC077644 TaxID=3155055 RepID=UPI00344FC434